MDLGLTGRVYVVSGGSRGIGLATARLLVAEGARVATFARYGDVLGAAWSGGPAAVRDRLLLGSCDALDAGTVREFVDGAVEYFGRLDGVVAGAGAGATGPVLGTPPDVWSGQFEIKVRAALALVEPAAPHLARSGGGSVVLLNGVTAHAPEAGMAAVGAARAALANVATLLGGRLAPDGTRVNTVNPGAILTDRQRHKHTASGSSLPFDRWCDEEATRRRIPLRRFGQPEDVAAAVAYLLSPRAAYVTGATLDVAGGLGSGF